MESKNLDKLHAFAGLALLLAESIPGASCELDEDLPGYYRVRLRVPIRQKLALYHYRSLRGLDRCADRKKIKKEKDEILYSWLVSV